MASYVFDTFLPKSRVRGLGGTSVRFRVYLKAFLWNLFTDRRINPSLGGFYCFLNNKEFVCLRLHKQLIDFFVHCVLNAEPPLFCSWLPLSCHPQDYPPPSQILGLLKKTINTFFLRSS